MKQDFSRLKFLCRLTTIMLLGAIAAGAMLTLQGWKTVQWNRRKPNLSSENRQPTSQQVSQQYGQLPLSFEVNQGQTDPQVKFLARGSGYAVFLTPDEAVLSLHRNTDEKFARQSKESKGVPPAAAAPAVVRLRLAGANPSPKVTGKEPLRSRSNYFIGNEPAKWRADVAHFAKVEYNDVYPGINQVFYGNQGQLEYDFIVAPGARPDSITLKYEGADQLLINEQGELLLKLANGEMYQRRPHTYQEVNGERRTIASRYVLKDRDRIGIAVANYDTTQPLIIDPVLVYSTYLGGSGQEAGYGIAADYSLFFYSGLRDTIYITGSTASLKFPTKEAGQSQSGGDTDVFVLGLNLHGKELIFATYLGGSGKDTGYSIRFWDGLFIAGTTASTDFPTSKPTQANYGGGESDAFVAHLFPDSGGLLFSTFIGGSGKDTGYGVGYRPGNLVYVTGSTNSMDFGASAGSLQPTYGGGGSDAFVVHLDLPYSDEFPQRPARIVYSTYLGGSGDDVGYGIEGGLSPTLGGVHTSDYPLVVGVTSSTNFPLRNPTQPGYGGGESDAFVTRLTSTGRGLGFSTYLGGSGKDAAHGITLSGDTDDSLLNSRRLKAYIIGSTSSLDFPTKDPLQPSYGGGESDAFVVKLGPAFGVPQIFFSTYLGGSGRDVGYSVAVPLFSRVYDQINGTSPTQISLTGSTNSADFPLKDATQPIYGGGASDAFVTYLSQAGRRLLFSTYFGGSGQDTGYGIAYDNEREIGHDTGRVYLTGQTDSASGITTPGTFQPDYGGGTDAFIASFNSNYSGSSSFDLVIEFSPVSLTIPSGGTGRLTLILNTTRGSATEISLTSSNPAVASVPAAVTIPADESEVSFNVAGGSAGGPVTITARLPAANGGGSATAIANVSATPPTLTLSPASQTVQAGLSVNLTLTLGYALSTDTSVVLTSSNNAIAPVRSSVSIFAGDSSVGFSILTAAEATAGVVTITAMLPASLGGGSTTATITLTPGCAVTPINFGQTVNGTLSASDCLSPQRRNSGIYRADRYSFIASAGQKVTLSVQSGSFNPSLYLLWSGNNFEVNNGDDGSSSIARIPRRHGFFTLPLSGTYIIEVTSRVAGGTGNYTLILNRQAQSPELAVDDGTYEDSIGLTNGGTITFVNRLTPTSYPATLTDVAIFFLTDRGPRAGDALTILIATHPGGETNINGMSFQSVPGTVQTVAQYNVYDVPDLTINSGDFLVGFRITHAQGVYPAAYDRNSPSKQRSYASTDGSVFQIIDTLGSQLAGNFGIRARLIPPATASISAASYNTDLASESIVAAFGPNLATTTQAATAVPLPTELAGTMVRVTDSTGTERLAPLFFVSANQVNYLIPAGTATGAATVTITSGTGAVAVGTVQIATVAPGLFTANADGQGVPAGYVLRYRNGQPIALEAITEHDAQNRFVTRAIDLSVEGDDLFLVLFGTGVRFHNGLPGVTASLGGANAEVFFAGAQPDFAGLDQINLRLPRNLAGRGEVEATLTVQGKTTNTVKLRFK